MRDPPLAPGEKIVRRGSASLRVGLYGSSWKPVNLALTNRRILICQPSFRAIWQTQLDKVNEVTIVKTRFILGLKRNSLYIETNGTKQCVAVNNPEEWKTEIMRAKADPR